MAVFRKILKAPKPWQHKELAAKLRELEGRILQHDEEILAILEAMRQLMTPPAISKKRIYPVESGSETQSKSINSGDAKESVECINLIAI